jgi:hypothetical protein
MTTFVLALVWAPVAYFLHCLLHELSHALMVRLYGGKVTSLHLLPSRVDGKIRWAHMTYVSDRPLSDLQKFNIAVSPVQTEFAWLLTMAAMAHFVPTPYNGILLAEMIACVVDMTTWFIGMLRNSEGTDGAVARKLLAFESDIFPLVVGFLGLCGAYAIVIVRLVAWLG